jgi:hypothetical protein
MGPWKTLIDARHYRRNLFEGLDIAPSVAPDAILLVADRAVPEPILPVLTWLRTVGLDRSTPIRAIAVLADLPAARRLAAAIGGPVALYRPITRRYGAA